MFFIKGVTSWINFSCSSSKGYMLDFEYTSKCTFPIKSATSLDSRDVILSPYALATINVGLVMYSNTSAIPLCLNTSSTASVSSLVEIELVSSTFLRTYSLYDVYNSDVYLKISLVYLHSSYGFYVRIF